MNKLPFCFTTRAGCVGANECVSGTGTGTERDRWRETINTNLMSTLTYVPRAE